MNAETLFLAGAGAADYESVPTRTSLLSRLRNVGDEASWRLFFETYWRLLYNVARKSGLEDADARLQFGYHCLKAAKLTSAAPNGPTIVMPMLSSR